MKILLKIIIVVAALVPLQQVCAQSLSLDEAVQQALQNNLQIKAGEYEVRQFEQLKKSSFDLGKTNVLWMRGNYNSVNTDNNITITQTIPFPSVIVQQSKFNEAQRAAAGMSLTVSKSELTYQVRNFYLQLTYLKELQKLLHSQDSLYTGFARAADVRFQTGETNLLEKTTAETQLIEIKNQRQQNDADIIICQTQLKALLNTSTLPDAAQPLAKLNYADTVTFNTNPQVALSRQQAEVSRYQTKLERNRFLPDVSIGYFTQTLIGYQRVGNTEQYFDSGDRFDGFQLGLSFPLWFVPQQGRAKAALMAETAAQQRAAYAQVTLQASVQQAMQEFEKNKVSLSYYEGGALRNATLIQDQAQKAYAAGEIGYVEYLQALRQSLAIRTGYLSVLNQYNQSISRLNFLAGQ